MKRLIMINLLLVFLLNILPVEATAEKKQTVETLQTAEVTAEITSRSLEEPRKEHIVANNKMLVESDKIESKATKISEQGINLIKKYEGLSLKAYKQNSNEEYYTIGYGTYNKNITKDMAITVEEAEVLLMEELEEVEKYVNKYCGYLNLTQSQFDGLASFTFNVGQANLKKLTGNGERSIEEIAEKITNYTKSGSEANRNGLKKRREEEKKFIMENQ